MTDYSQMTRDDIAEQLAVKVMGWYLDMVENEWGLRFYKGADGNAVMDIRLWKPAEDLNQAVECAEKLRPMWIWDLDGTDIGFTATLKKEPTYQIVKTAVSKTSPARALCEAVLMAVDNGQS